MEKKFTPVLLTASTEPHFLTYFVQGDTSMRTDKKTLRWIALIFNTFYCLSVCLLLTVSLSVRPSIAASITTRLSVMAQTDTAERVGNVITEKLVEKVLGIAKDAIDLGKALVESDVANPKGSQPEPNERIENFLERTGRPSGNSGSSKQGGNSGGGKNGL